MKRILFVLTVVLFALFFFTGTGPPQMAMIDSNSVIFATAPQKGIGSPNIAMAITPALNDQIFTARPYGFVTNAAHTDLYNKALATTVTRPEYSLRC